MKRTGSELSNMNVVKKARFHEALNMNPRLEVDNIHLFFKKIDDLKNTIGQYLSIYLDDKTLSSAYHNLSYERILMVAFGSQSSGKSTCMNKLFSMKQQTGVSITTRCPTEKMISITCDNETYIDYNGLTLCESSGHAEKIVIDRCEKEKGQLANCKIVEKIHFKNKELIIVDLPGCTPDRKLDVVFDHYRNIYLVKKESIILHFCNGITDLTIDASLNYLAGLEKSIVTIITNVDVWTRDGKDKMDILLKCINDSPAHTIALVGMFKDDKLEDSTTVEAMKLPLITTSDAIKKAYNCDTLFALQEYIHSKTSKEMILGINQLAKYIVQAYYDKYTTLRRYIQDILFDDSLLIQTMLESLSNFNPGQERNTFSEQFEKKLSDNYKGRHVILNHELSRITEIINVDKMRRLINTLPSITTLKNEMAHLDISDDIGAERWKFIVTKYVSYLMDKLFTNTCSVMVDEFVATYHKLFCRVMDDSNPVNEHARKYIMNRISCIGIDIKRIMNDDIRKALNIKANTPYHNTFSLIKRMIDNVVRDTGIATLQHINSSSHDVIHNEDFHNILIRKLEHKFVSYEYLAKNALEHIQQYWTTEVDIIHEYLVKIMTKYSIQFMKLVQTEIRNVKVDVFVEPVYLIKKRDALQQIVDAYDKL